MQNATCRTFVDDGDDYYDDNGDDYYDDNGDDDYDDDGDDDDDGDGDYLATSCSINNKAGDWWA